MSTVRRDEQKALDPDARARLVIVGVLIVVISTIVGLIASNDRPGLRGSIDAAQAMIEGR